MNNKKKLTIHDWAKCIGQDVAIFGDPNDVAIITGVDINHIDFDSVMYNYDDNHKPILRTLDMMTEEEWNELKDMFDPEKKWNVMNLDYSNLKRIKIQYNSKLSTNERGVFISVDTNMLDWLREKDFCLNPEWIANDLVIIKES